MDKNYKDVYKQVDIVVKSLRERKEIAAAYLYGSILSKKFIRNKSDVDVLLIVSDVEYPSRLIDDIKQRVKVIGRNIKLDVNIVFMTEFINRWHIYRPPTYFIGIKHRHKLLWGQDLLADIDDREVTPDLVYKRLVDLAQSSRGIYVNNKEPKFWVKKYASWLKIAALEVLFLTGEFDLSFVSGFKKLKNKYHNLEFLNILNKTRLTIKDINYVAENLCLFVYNNWIKKVK